MISDFWSTSEPSPSAPEPVDRLDENSLAGPEFSRLLRIADPGLVVLPKAAGAPTFHPLDLSADDQSGGPSAPAVQRWRSAWLQWVKTIFAPTLAPALVRAALCAAQDNARELRDADLALAAALPPAALEGARAPGRRLLHRLGVARAARWVPRMQAWAAAGETPALFPTVFAGQCALFHLPLRPMLLGYAYFEWRAAARRLPRPDSVVGEPADALAPIRLCIEATLAAAASPATDKPGLGPWSGNSSQPRR